MPNLRLAEPNAGTPNTDLIASALVSNTTTSEASRLLLDDDNPSADWRTRAANGSRALDLMSLIDAVVLHEQLFFCPLDQRTMSTDWSYGTVC